MHLKFLGYSHVIAILFFAMTSFAGMPPVNHSQIQQTVDDNSLVINPVIRTETGGNLSSISSQPSNQCVMTDLRKGPYMVSCSLCGINPGTCGLMWQAQCIESLCRPNGCSESPGCKTETKIGDDEGQSYSTRPAAQLPAEGPIPFQRPNQPAEAAGGGGGSGNGSPSEQATGGEGSATGDPQADLNSCRSLQTEAHRCCTNPSACMDLGQAQYQAPPPSDKEGLKLYCQQQQMNAGAGGNANLDAGTMCYQKYTSCRNSCNSMASSHQGSTAQNLRVMGNSCDKLAPRASALGKQARTAYNSNGYAGVCDSLTQANPNSLPMPPPGGQQDDSPLQKAQSDFCRRNPSAADCQTQNETAANGNPENNPSPGFDNGSDLAEASGEGRFNLPGADSQLDPSGFGPLDGIEAQSLSYGTVANNSGGSIPGGGDSGSAQLGGPAGGVQRGGSPGSPGYSTDIMQGNRSGGYSQPVGMNNNGSDDGSGSDYRRNQGGRHTASSDAPRMGLDLKQFLPGGSKDPLRRVGGMRRGKDIHGPSVDIWNKISTRFKHECRLTPLYDCDI